MAAYLAEFIGTMILVILGDGVVANAVLDRTKGHDAGWLAITTGWGLAVTVAVYCVNPVSGAHINPAVTIGLAAAGGFSWSQVPGYLIAQMLGGFFGAVVVWVLYQPHWGPTESADAKLGVFCTGPAIRSPGPNFMAEVVGTAVLVFGVKAMLSPDNLAADSGFGRGLGPLLVGLLVFSIGLSLGGLTGYAINPARDLGPRIAHQVLPIPGKRDSDWSYAWIPVIGPVVGGIVGAGLYAVLFR